MKNEKLKIKNKDEAKIEKLKKEIEELEGNWKRAVADYQNLRKRIDKEKENFVKYANRRLLKDLLSVWDALEKAVAHTDVNEGVKLILRQLDDVLLKEGVEKIEVKVGDKFDPEIMEAIETVKKGKRNIVGEVLRNGFKYKDRVLRPAEVKVYI